MTSSLISKIGEMAADKDSLAKIGNDLVVKAVREAAAEKAGLTPVNPDTIVTLPPGSRIPPEWMIENVALGPDGTLETGWEKTWTNLGLWERNWHQNETDMIRTDFTNPETILKLKDVLEPSEFEMLESLKLVGGP